MTRQQAKGAERDDGAVISAVVAQASQALIVPILSSPISPRSRVRWAIIASKGSSMTEFTAWVRKRIGTSGAPETRTIAAARAVIAMLVEKKIGSLLRLPAILPPCRTPPRP
jgi:hypothetical protein